MFGKTTATAAFKLVSFAAARLKAASCLLRLLLRRFKCSQQRLHPLQPYDRLKTRSLAGWQDFRGENWANQQPRKVRLPNHGSTLYRTIQTFSFFIFGFELIVFIIFWFYYSIRLLLFFVLSTLRTALSISLCYNDNNDVLFYSRSVHDTF